MPLFSLTISVYHLNVDSLTPEFDFCVNIHVLQIFQPPGVILTVSNFFKPAMN